MPCWWWRVHKQAKQAGTWLKQAMAFAIAEQHGTLSNLPAHSSKQEIQYWRHRRNRRLLTQARSMSPLCLWQGACTISLSERLHVSLSERLHATLSKRLRVVLARLPLDQLLLLLLLPLLLPLPRSGVPV